MFSFDGDFRRKPLQSLGGSSQKSDRNTIIKNAQVERQRREQHRKETHSITKIQAHVRSFVCRQKCKTHERKNFDDYLKKYGIAIDDQQHLDFLLKRLIFFYDFMQDGERIISLCQNILKNPKCLFQRVNESLWSYRIKKLLNCCIQQIRCENFSSAIPLRMLEVFTDFDSVLKFIHNNPYVAQQYLEVIFHYLIDKKYFLKIREFANERIPSIDEDDNYHSPIGDAIIQMLMRPLRLIEMSNEELIEKILTSFCHYILCHEYSSQIRYFVIPQIAKQQNFPFIQMLEIIANIRQKEIEYRKTILVDIEPEKKSKKDVVEFSSFLLHAILTLDQPFIIAQMNEKHVIRNYFTVLSALIGNLQKLPKQSKYGGGVGGNDSDDDDDNDDDHDVEMYSFMEINVLTDTLALMNETKRVIFIVQRVELFLDEPEIMLDLCNIQHSLMTCNKSMEFKLLYMLAFKPKFIRSIWFTLTAHSAGRGFTSPIGLISKGLGVSKQEADRLIPYLATFCTLFGQLISTLHDGEFTNDNNISISKVMPFTLEDLVPLSTTLKEICLGLVELAFPETRLNLTEQYRTMLSNLHEKTASHQQITSAIWSHLLKVSVALLRQLHTRDLRLNFCPDGHWTAKLLNLPLDKADLHVTRNRRGLRPFQPLRDFTRDDVSDGPPLSTKQIRSITILREIPFVVEFNRRVSIFQGLLATDKLRSQGDLQGFLQGPSINILVRRYHLYEDAFDKLSIENEPDLRPRFRVQLVNITGLEEAGIDGGGVFREFLSELIKTAFDPHRGFFMITNDNMLYPNPAVGKIVEDYQRHYFFIGRIVGKALYENLLVELPLAEFFLSKLAGKHSDVDVHQLASLDPDLHKNLMSLKAYEGDVADLGLDFTVVCDELGEKRVEELKPNGSKIMVNQSNRMEYIQLMADFKLNRQIRSQCMAFRQGLANVLPIEWLYMFSNKELQVLISGAEIPVDLVDLRQHTRYGGDFTPEHPTILLFWKVVENFSDLQRRQLLKFVTSCSRPPLLGFKDLDPAFCIQNAGADRLPSASTCMNLLKLPAFDSEDVLRDKLLYAIQSGAGFELS